MRRVSFERLLILLLYDDRLERNYLVHSMRLVDSWLGTSGNAVLNISLGESIMTDSRLRAQSEHVVLITVIRASLGSQRALFRFRL